MTPRPKSSDAEDEKFESFRKAVFILRAATQAKNRPVAYLEARGIKSVPANAAVLPAADAERLTGKRYPAMVLPVTNERDELQGAHVTWLSADASAKLAVSDGRPRRVFGTETGGFIRLAPADPERALVVGEGVETTLSAMQLSGLPGIAAISATNMKSITLPKCREGIIAADADEPGRKGARELAANCDYLGVKVRRVLPPKADTDWNNVLTEDDDAEATWRDAFAKDAPREEEDAAAEFSHPVEEFMQLTFPKREMLMSPWLPKPGIAMLFARAGHAKTFVALGVGFAVANGRKFLDWECARPGRVLYIDGEMPGSYLQQRLAVYGTVPQGMLHIVCRDDFLMQREMMPDLGTPAGRRAIDNIIKWVEPDLVILDSLSTLVRTGEEFLGRGLGTGARLDHGPPLVRPLNTDRPPRW